MLVRDLRNNTLSWRLVRLLSYFGEAAIVRQEH